MARYSKSYSNYILRKVHTTVNGGTIFERDWSTLGERHVIEPGKKKIYSDGNFLFTDNNTAGLQKRNFTGEWSEPYTLDNIDPNINGKVNDTTILSPSNDLRDYAYYGSAAELVRATVEKIIREFPGRVYSENARLQRYDETDGEWLVLDSVSSDDNGNFTLTWGNDPYNGLWAVRNPFNIDLSTQDPVLGPNDNRMRSLPLSWQLYLCNGGAIGSWNVWTRPYTECVDDYDVICEITFSASDGPRPCEMTLVADDGKTPCRITVSNGGGSGQTQFGHIWCIQHGRETVWVTDMANMEIRPDDTLIEKYFLKAGRAYTYRTLMNEYYRYRDTLDKDDPFLFFMDTCIGRYQIWDDPNLPEGVDLSVCDLVPEYGYYGESARIYSEYCAISDMCAAYEAMKRDMGEVNCELECLLDRYARIGGDLMRGYYRDKSLEMGLIADMILEEYAAPLGHGLFGGEKVVLRDKSDPTWSREWTLNVVSVQNSTEFVMETVPHGTSPYVSWHDICEGLGNGQYALNVLNTGIPGYAARVKSNTYLWRNQTDIWDTDNQTDGLEEFPFANGHLYIDKVFNLFVRRQDPYGCNLLNDQTARHAETASGETADTQCMCDPISQIQDELVDLYKDDTFAIC